jgi:hypothetical protein
VHLRNSNKKIQNGVLGQIWGWNRIIWNQKGSYKVSCQLHFFPFLFQEKKNIDLIL